MKDMGFGHGFWTWHIRSIGDWAPILSVASFAGGLFGALLARDTFAFNYPCAPAAFVDEFRKYYGPTMNAGVPTPISRGIRI